MMPEQLKTASTVIAMIQRGAMAQMICVAAELRIADVLADGPMHVDGLAQATKSHAPSLHRLLRALASLDLCAERDDGSFALSPSGSPLLSDAQNSLRSWLLWFGKYHWPAWGKLLHSVKTGENARKLATGNDGFVRLLERDPEAAELFNETMGQLTRLVAGEMVRAYDFTGMRRIVDVGGGHGVLLAIILQANPALQGVLFDLPHAIAGARTQIEKAGLSSRCEFVAGSFFESIPPGADAYLLKNVVHDWDDKRSATILQTCRYAVPPHGKLLLIERIMPARLQATEAHRAMAYADLAMLVGPGGRQRTEVEFQNLFDASGFALTRVISTALEYCIFEAVPR